MRTVMKTSAGIEDLYHMLRTEPIVKQKKTARNFAYKEGAI